MRKPMLAVLGVSITLGVLLTVGGACGSPADPVVGFEAYQFVPGKIEALAVTRTGFVKHVVIVGDQLTYQDDTNALASAGVSGAGDVVACAVLGGTVQLIVTSTGEIVRHYSESFWVRDGNAFAMAGTQALGATVTGVTKMYPDCACLILVASDGRVLSGYALDGGSQWKVLGRIDEQPVEAAHASWGAVKARYR